MLRLATEKLLAAGVVVDLRPATILPALIGRPNGLRALFSYLIDNAIHAVSESGRDYRELRIQTRTENGDVVVESIDNGLGIPSEAALRVFEPFYSNWKNRRDHAGMGLTLAQEIVNDHDGSIEIDAHFLGGCRVFARLPYDRELGGDA